MNAILVEAVADQLGNLAERTAYENPFRRFHGRKRNRHRHPESIDKLVPLEGLVIHAVEHEDPALLPVEGIA